MQQKLQATNGIVCHRRYLLLATTFVARNMLPRIERMSIPRNFVATKHQRQAACCTQQYSYDTLGDLLPATVACNKVSPPLAKLRCCNLQFNEQYVSLHIRSSKTDWYQQGDQVLVAKKINGYLPSSDVREIYFDGKHL